MIKFRSRGQGRKRRVYPIDISSKNSDVMSSEVEKTRQERSLSVSSVISRDEIKKIKDWNKQYYGTEWSAIILNDGKVIYFQEGTEKEVANDLMDPTCKAQAGHLHAHPPEYLIRFSLQDIYVGAYSARKRFLNSFRRSEKDYYWNMMLVSQKTGKIIGWKFNGSEISKEDLEELSKLKTKQTDKIIRKLKKTDGMTYISD